MEGRGRETDELDQRLTLHELEAPSSREAPAKKGKWDDAEKTRDQRRSSSSSKHDDFEEIRLTPA